MRVGRVVPNLTVVDLARAVEEHRSVLGLEVLMDHGWIATLSDDAGHQLSLMATDGTAPLNPNVPVFANDAHEALERVEATGMEMVHPLAEEPWGATRFSCRGSHRHVNNVGMHPGVSVRTFPLPLRTFTAHTDYMSEHIVHQSLGLPPQRRRRDRMEWWLLAPAISLGGVGVIVGLILGLATYWKTAPFAVFEVGIPSAILGGILGVIALAGYSAIKYSRARL